jgi:hypothetical protein
MVIIAMATLVPLPCLKWGMLAEQKLAEPLLERLDPPRRAAVVMALLAITIVGLFLVAVVMLGGNWARRLARRRHGPSHQNKNVENERLRSALKPILPVDNSGETIIVNKRSSDTVVNPQHPRQDDRDAD